jgi:multidrug efflux system membrane fusion protein
MRKWVLLPAIFLGVAALALAVYDRSSDVAAVAQTPDRAGPPTVPVSAEKAVTKDMPVYVRGIGTGQAYNTVTIKSRVDGQIMKVDFTEGQEVKQGDLLFEIDPRPYQAALALASANKAKDEAQLASVQADLERDEKLLASNFQTRQAYDQQKALVGQVQGSIAGDVAQIQTAQLNLQYADIRSPIDGRTGARLVDVGNLVHATDNAGLVSITQLRPIFVSFTEPQNDFEVIRASQLRTPISVEALSGDGSKKLGTGKLSLIDNQIDPASGTIHLKAVFDNTQETLWPGEFVNLQLVVNTLKNAVTVPARAIQQGPNGPYLFVVKSDMTVEVRNVGVSETENGYGVISKGLDPGETVVVDGQYRLDEGTRVSLQSPATQGG